MLASQSPEGIREPAHGTVEPNRSEARAGRDEDERAGAASRGACGRRRHSRLQGIAVGIETRPCGALATATSETVMV